MDKEKMKNTLILNSEEVSAFFQEVLECDVIEDERALGVMKAFIGGMPEKLSDNQWHVLLDHGLNPVYQDGCKRCANPIPWREMLAATYIYEDGYCSYCRHMEEKD